MRIKYESRFADKKSRPSITNVFEIRNILTAIGCKFVSTGAPKSRAEQEALVVRFQKLLRRANVSPTLVAQKHLSSKCASTSKQGAKQLSDQMGGHRLLGPVTQGTLCASQQHESALIDMIWQP